MRTRSLVFLATIAIIGGIAIAIWRGTGPLPDPEQCEATVAGRTVPLSTEQGRNAALIAAIGVQRGLPARAVSIALATAYQESKIRNLAGGDRDSIGLFQQRPSQGWGTPAQIRDEHYSINKFYEALEKIHGYETMRITEAAQEVQRSGYPEAYEEHAPDARALASALTGYSTGGAFTCVWHTPKGHSTASVAQSSLDDAFGTVGAARTGSRQDFTISVDAGIEGNRRGWAYAQYLVAMAGPLKIHEVTYDGRTWKTGRASEKGWQRSTASPTKVSVSLG
ncbi:MAG: hypothetical protein ACJ72E_04255 [Marmoricola sp.]